jgi:RNA polymerase sigma-70 factor (ECF subfamily)
MDQPVDRAPTPGQVTPLSLLERLRTNDESAWQQLVQLYGSLVRYWCRRAGLRDEDVADVTQEIFAAAAAGFGGFHRDRPGDTFRGWLRGITRIQIQSHFRRNHGRPHAEGGSDAWQNLQEVADPQAQPDADEQTAASQVYLRALEQVRGYFEPQTWEAFWRSAVDGRTPAELTQELGMTSAAIRQAKSRVLRRLKQELGELLG